MCVGEGNVCVCVCVCVGEGNLSYDPTHPSDMLSYGHYVAFCILDCGCSSYRCVCVPGSGAPMHVHASAVNVLVYGRKQHHASPFRNEMKLKLSLVLCFA